MSYHLRTAGEDDWERVRALRLEMLADSPAAYMETRESALALDETAWRWRAAGHGRPAQSTVRWVAEHDGDWVATASAFVSEGDVHLVAFYVRPDHRGTGVADELVAAVLAWARDTARLERVVLRVVEDNGRARAYYRKAGFVETGRTFPYELDASRQEFELMLPARD